jgi:hypothetical protein
MQKADMPKKPIYKKPSNQKQKADLVNLRKKPICNKPMLQKPDM